MKPDPKTSISRLSMKPLICVGLAVLTFAVFGSALNYPLLGFDDPEYVSANPHVQAGLTRAGIGWGFTTFDTANWHPLTWLSLQVDAQIWGGRNARGFHATNICLHAASSVLLFLALANMTGQVWRSAVLAALFGIHPLRAESVAWVAERKDVLSTFFLMLTILAYGSYVRRPGGVRFALVAVFLVLGLLAKSMLVTLPFMLLLLDYWPLQRWQPGASRGTAGRLIMEKVPLLVPVIVTGVLTVIAHDRGQHIASIEAFPLPVRVENALLAYAGYLGKLFWPAGLAAYYPHPSHLISVYQAIAAAAFLSAVTFLVLGPGRRWPYLVVGWLWYLIALLPAIGLVQVGSMAMADRYTYVPMIGIYLMLVWAAGDLVVAWQIPREAAAAVAALLVAVSSYLTWNQVKYWKDDITLWTHTLDVTSGNVIAHKNLGDAFALKGMRKEAIAEYQKALEVDPKWVSSRWNLAVLLVEEHRPEEAIGHFYKVLGAVPGTVVTHYNLASALRETGSLDEAITQYQKAIELDDSLAESRYELGTVLQELGRPEEARAQYARAIDLDRRMVQAYLALSEALIEQGLYAEALKTLTTASRFDSPLNIWRDGIQKLVQRCERFVKLEQKLPDVLAKKSGPSGMQERLELAELCQFGRQAQYAAAAKLYSDAFAQQPVLASNSHDMLLHHAASAAVRAAAGEGIAAAHLEPAEQARLRSMALEWLKADLAYWQRWATSSLVGDRTAAAHALRREQHNPALASVREPARLGTLSAEQRQAWQEYWVDVEATLRKMTSPH